MSYILFFDSGLGGLSVLREAIKQHPELNYIYVADNLNMPYGDRPPEEVAELTLSTIASVYEKYPIRAITVACNTATSAAITRLREIYSDIPVLGIEPALKPAAERHPGGRIGVMATKMTLSERKFRELLSKYDTNADITSIPCPGLVDFVERGELEGGKLEKFLSDIFAPYTQPFDCIVLGCTHYPFVKNAVYNVTECRDIIDGGLGTANNLFRRIKDIPCDTPPAGKRIFINTANDPEFEMRAGMLLNS